MVMDWAKVEAITGHKIIFSSIIGSRRFGLNHDESDLDYAVYVSPDPNSSYDPNIAYKLRAAGNADLFFTEVDKLKSLVQCASLYGVQHYGSVEYAPPDVYDFFMNNHKDLANMAMYHTYRTCIDVINTLFGVIDDGDIKRLKQVVCNAGIIHNLRSLGDVEDSFTLSEKFYLLYKDLQANPGIYSSNDIRGMINFLYSSDMDAHFKSIAPNMTTYNALQSVLTPYYSMER